MRNRVVPHALKQGFGVDENQLIAVSDHVLVVAVVAPQDVEDGGEPAGVMVEVRQLFVAGTDFVRDIFDVPVAV